MSNDEISKIISMVFFTNENENLKQELARINNNNKDETLKDYSTSNNENILFSNYLFFNLSTDNQ